MVVPRKQYPQADLLVYAPLVASWAGHFTWRSYYKYISNMQPNAADKDSITVHMGLCSHSQ